MKKILVSPLILFLLVLNHLHAQHITGFLIDAESKKPVPNASIQLGKRGVISDLNGQFKLSIRETDWEQNLQLKISSIGYHSQQFPIRSLKNESTIKMVQQTNDLQEVIVKSSARELVQKALDAIPKNYPQYKFVIKGTVIETNKKTKLDTIYQLAFQTNTLMSYKKGERKKTNVQLVSYAKSSGYPSDSSDYLHWRNDGKIIEQFDFVLSEIHFLNPSKLSLYTYQLIDIKTFNNKSTYQIKFQLKEKPETYEGTIYIEEESLAIIGFDFLYAEYKNENKPDKKEETALSEGKVRYKQHGDVWVLDHINYNKYAKIKNIPGYVSLIFQTDKVDTTQNSLFLNYKNRLTSDIMMEKLSQEIGIFSNDSIQKLIAKKVNQTSRVMKKSPTFRLETKSFIGISTEIFHPTFSDQSAAWTNFSGSSTYHKTIGNSPILTYGFSSTYKCVGFSLAKQTGIPFVKDTYGGNVIDLFVPFMLNKKGRPIIIKPSVGRNKFIYKSTIEDFTPTQSLQKTEGLSNENYSAQQRITIYSYQIGLSVGVHLTRSKIISLGIKYNMAYDHKIEFHMKKSSNNFFQNLFDLNSKDIIPPFSIISNIPNQINYNLTYQF